MTPGRGAARYGWTLSILVILALTTLPAGNFQGHSHWYMVTWVPFTDKVLKARDLVGNVLLFVPFGLTCPFAAGRTRGTRLALVSGLALALSVGVETYQVFCHNRFASATDVMLNVVGAIIGARLVPAGQPRA